MLHPNEHASGPFAANPNLRAAPRGGDTPRRTDPRTPQRLDSRRLLDGGNEAVIEHAGQEYRLRLTRNDKLILTK
jgi:hemin uptake protein HemP